MLESKQLEKHLKNFEAKCVLENIPFDYNNTRVINMKNGEEHREQAKYIKPYKRHSAIYIFGLVADDVCLKVGKAGENSDARLRSHHYSPKRAMSTLAGSILNDRTSPYHKQNNAIGDWIKDNTQKIICFLPKGTSESVRSNLEKYLQSVLHPIYG